MHKVEITRCSGNSHLSLRVIFVERQNRRERATRENRGIAIIQKNNNPKVDLELVFLIRVLVCGGG